MHNYNKVNFGQSGNVTNTPISYHFQPQLELSHVQTL